jgi:hypothetical protein
MASDFLLELGTEEIPASYIQPALDAMSTMLSKTMSDQRISHGDIKTMATPRRLVWCVSGVAEKQESQTVEVTGPPKQAAFDEAGNPTQAALGFAKAQGVSPDELQVKQTAKGEYVVVTSHQPGVSTVEATGSDPRYPISKIYALGKPESQLCQTHPLDCGPVGQGGRAVYLCQRHQWQYLSWAPVHEPRTV